MLDINVLSKNKNVYPCILVLYKSAVQGGGGVKLYRHVKIMCMSTSN